MNKEFNKGLLLAGFGSFWWGFFGVLYFKYITFIGYIELVIHRCLWTTLTLILTTFFFSKWDLFFKIIKCKQNLIYLFISGFLIDKFTSRKILIYMNIPLLLSTIVIILFDHPNVSFLFLGLIGISNGFANVLGSSTWAEIYGVRYIGSIKALTTALMVFSTAFGTALFGFLIDKGFSIEQIATISGIYISTALVFLFFIRNKLNPIKI